MTSVSAGSLGRRRALLAALAVTTAIGCSEPAPDYTFHDACDPRAAPDAACYASKRDPASPRVALALRLAHRYIDEHPATDLAWDWGPGVLMYAMTELARVTNDARVRAYYASWLDHHLTAGYAIEVSDGCPPALTAIARRVETGDQRYDAVVDGVFHYLDVGAARTADGGIGHLGQLAPTVWVDSLFMFGMVLNRWSEVTDDRRRLDQMGEQLEIFARALQRDGFFLHSQGWPLAHDDVFWARGNGWVTVAAADYLRVRALRHDDDAAVLAIASAQAAAVIAAQDPSNRWHTLLDRPDTYLETSATALFAYGLARGYRYGVHGSAVLPIAHRAVEGVIAAIVDDALGRPVVTGISGPTIVDVVDGYTSVPLVDDLHYGVGAAILALIETSGLPP